MKIVGHEKKPKRESLVIRWNVVSRKRAARSSTPSINRQTLSIANISIAAICGVALFQYTEFVQIVNGDGTFSAPDIPAWRAHMMSVWLGSVSFVVALFCLEALVRKSKTVALRSVIPWFPFVVLTGVATIYHIHFLIVFGASLAYGASMYWRRKRTLPAIHEI